MYIAAAEKQGVKPEQLRGTVQNDILKEYMAQHAWCFPIEPALRSLITVRVSPRPAARRPAASPE